MTSPRKLIVPKELVRPGVVWGVADGLYYAYAETRGHLRAIPDAIDGVRVVKRVVGAIRPARPG
jgi:hypothetical protein